MLKKSTFLPVVDSEPAPIPLVVVSAAPAPAPAPAPPAKLAKFASMVCVISAENKDKFYEMSLDPTPLEGQWLLVRRWGRSGTKGQNTQQVFKDDDYPKGLALFNALLAQKKRKGYQDVTKASSTLAPVFSWEYYVNDGVDNKPTGWYPYDKHGNETMNETYHQYLTHHKEFPELQFRSFPINSGFFFYRVDFTGMTQKNTETGKERSIRFV